MAEENTFFKTKLALFGTITMLAFINRMNISVPKTTSFVATTQYMHHYNK